MVFAVRDLAVPKFLRLKNALSHLQLGVLILMLMSPILSLKGTLPHGHIHSRLAPGGRWWDYAGGFISLTSSASWRNCMFFFHIQHEQNVKVFGNATKVTLVVQYLYGFHMVDLPEDQVKLGDVLFFVSVSRA